MVVRVALVCLLLSAVARGSSCPDDMVQATSSVCIDRYEWSGFNMEGRPAAPYLAFSGRMEPDGNPLVMDAEGLCIMRGRRVCTLSEWSSACRGPGGSKYPYGDVYDPSACNTDKLWRAFDIKKVYLRDENELARLNQSSVSGSHPRCVSAAGAYDMIGNAEEWVRCAHGKFGWCLAGGYWAHPSTCADAIVSHSPYWHFYETGARCCLDVHGTDQLP